MISSELLGIMAPAFVAGIMIAVTHAPLGISVLKRGIIFIDLAIAQIAGLGLVMAGIFLHEPSWWIVQATALSFALIAAFLFQWIEQKTPAQQEALIGSSFILAASLALLLLANHPHGGDEIRHLLSGQILFVSWPDILSHAPIYILILCLWFILPRVRQGLPFYIIFAIAITSSVQLVGVYVVFASLILPALSSLGSRAPHKTAWLCGGLAVTSGMTIATYQDLPAGPMIVVAYVVVCGVMKIQQLLARKAC